MMVGKRLKGGRRIPLSRANKWVRARPGWVRVGQMEESQIGAGILSLG